MTIVAHPIIKCDAPPTVRGAHLSGERPAVRRHTIEPDIELTCVSRQKLERLYESNLRRGRLVLPGDATQKRGSVSICLYLSDGSEMWLHGTASEVPASGGSALFVRLRPLSDIQQAQINAALCKPSLRP